MGLHTPNPILISSIWQDVQHQEKAIVQRVVETPAPHVVDAHAATVRTRPTPHLLTNHNPHRRTRRVTVQ